MSYRDCKVAAEAPLAGTPLALPRTRPLPAPMAAPAAGFPVPAPMSAPAAAPTTVPTAPLATALWFAASAGSKPTETVHTACTQHHLPGDSKGFPGAGNTIHSVRWARQRRPEHTDPQQQYTPLDEHTYSPPIGSVWTTSLHAHSLVTCAAHRHRHFLPFLAVRHPCGGHGQTAGSAGLRLTASYACYSPYIPTRHRIASIPVLRRGRHVTTKNPGSPFRRGKTAIPGRLLYPWPHEFNCTSSYGPEKANKGIKPTPDTATGGSEACRPPSSQIGIKRTSSSRASGRTSSPMAPKSA